DADIVDHPILQVAGRVHRIALQAVTEVVDHVTLTVGTEVAGAGVADLAIVAGDEEAVTVDGQVQGVLGVVDVALVEQLRYVAQQHAAALRVGSGTKHRGGIDVGEFGTRLLEARSASVGDVVAGDVEVAGGCPQTAETDIERH